MVVVTVPPFERLQWCTGFLTCAAAFCSLLQMQSEAESRYNRHMDLAWFTPLEGRLGSQKHVQNEVLHKIFLPDELATTRTVLQMAVTPSLDRVHLYDKNLRFTFLMSRAPRTSEEPPLCPVLRLIHPHTVLPVSRFQNR